MDLKIKLLFVNLKIYQLIYKLWVKLGIYINFLTKIYKKFFQKNTQIFKISP